MLLTEATAYANFFEQFFGPSKASLFSDCHLVENGRVEKAKFLYENCPDEAYESEAQAYEISKNFSVPTGLARRVGFWRKIYGFYGKNDYVIHSSLYPELVFETVHQFNPEDRVLNKPRNIIRKRSRYFRDLLARMQKLNGAFAENAEMVRIDKMMAHIKDPQKYINVSKTLRSQRGQREFVKLGLESFAPYRPYIEAEFDKLQLPRDLSRIAFVESSFNLRAYSKVGAAGVYQIMPFIGRKYMLMDQVIDERRDPIKSARVAAKLFKDNYRILGGHWPLAVTGYNHGPYGVKRAVKHGGSHDLVTLIETYNGKSFGFASKNFYAEFLAMLFTLKHADTIFGDISSKSLPNFSEETLKKSMKPRDLLKEFGVSRNVIESLNPDLVKAMKRSHYRIPRGYLIKLPLNEK